MSKNTRNRILLTALAALLLVVVAVGGTVAWLTDRSEQITNTFTTAGIDIELKETNKPDGTVVEDGVSDWSAQLIPGEKYAKNPVVSVLKETDVDIWLFVKYDENNINPEGKAALSYTSTLSETDSGWTQGTGKGDGGNGLPTDVWYRTVEANTIATATKGTCCDLEVLHWHLLKDDMVSIVDEITKDQIADGSGTMTWTAYAIQKTGFDSAAQAWEEVSKLDNTGN